MYPFLRMYFCLDDKKDVFIIPPSDPQTSLTLITPLIILTLCMSFKFAALWKYLRAIDINA